MYIRDIKLTIFKLRSAQIKTKQNKQNKTKQNKQRSKIETKQYCFYAWAFARRKLDGMSQDHASVMIMEILPLYCLFSWCSSGDRSFAVLMGLLYATVPPIPAVSDSLMSIYLVLTDWNLWGTFWYETHCYHWMGGWGHIVVTRMRTVTYLEIKSSDSPSP